MQNFQRLRGLLNTKIIPIITLDDPQLAFPLAEALVDAGLNVLEVTFRTAQAEAVMGEMIKVKNAIVGAGTIRSLEQIKKAQTIGCQFLVSPGAPHYLLEAMELTKDIDLLPGVATATEAMTASQRGYQYLKFFPAEAMGGAQTLQALVSPLQDLKFCATGGILPHNISKYIALPNVLNVGGSWMIDKAALNRKDFKYIHQLARDALQMI